MPSAAALPPDVIAPHIRRGRYLFVDPVRRGTLALVCAGWEECGPGFMVDRPSFRWHAVEYLESGQWEIRNGKRWTPAMAGTVVAYGPGRAGGIRATGQGPHFKYFADFLATPSRFQPGRPRRLAEPRLVMELYEQLLSCNEFMASRRELLADTLLQSLLLRIGGDEEPSRRAANHSRSVFHRCRAHLEENYARLDSLAEAARACHIGPEYLSRLFREYAGRTASQFLARLRMHHAGRLLRQTDLTVKAVGHSVGFEDPYHFSRVFKSIHGISPRAFRG